MHLVVGLALGRIVQLAIISHSTAMSRNNCNSACDSGIGRLPLKAGAQTRLSVTDKSPEPCGDKREPRRD